MVSYAVAFFVGLFFRHANQLLDYLPRYSLSFMPAKPLSIVF
jgi:hypothetical protein